MSHNNDLGAGLDKRGQGGQRSIDSTRIGDNAVFQWDVKVGADEDVTAFNTFVDQVFDSLNSHLNEILVKVCKKRAAGGVPYSGATTPARSGSGINQVSY